LTAQAAMFGFSSALIAAAVRARLLGQLVARGGEFSQGQLIETIDVGRHD
jgi:hypothetical protein